MLAPASISVTHGQTPTPSVQLGVTHDQGSHDRRGLGYAGVLYVVDPEPRGVQAGERVAVAVAAVTDSQPERVDAILPARDAWVVAADMLEKQQSSVGGEHAPDLGQRPGLVAYRAQDERRDDRVEARVLERQTIGWSLHDVRVRPRGGDPTFEPPGHRRLGLSQGQHDPITGVVAQVQSGAGAELERTSASAEQQPRAHLRQPSLLTASHHAVITGGEDTSVETDVGIISGQALSANHRQLAVRETSADEVELSINPSSSVSATGDVMRMDPIGS